MQFGQGMGPDTDWMRKELTELGVEELTTSEEVDEAMDQYDDGTMLMVINSVCGCAAGNARPAVKIALEHEHTPDHLTTVFAGQDKEATEQARSYFSDYPPSSPAFAFFKDGEIKAMIPRHRIERRTKEQIAKDLTMVFDAYCEVESEAE